MYKVTYKRKTLPTEQVETFTKVTNAMSFILGIYLGAARGNIEWATVTEEEEGEEDGS
jgi:hypothetical protein